MKVKLLWSHFLPDLDKKINEFIQIRQKNHRY